MNAARPPRRRRRRRRRATDRALDTRLVRVAALVVVPASLLALLTISAPGALPPPAVPPAFDAAAAAARSAELSAAYPSRVPGTPEAQLAAAWYQQTLRGLGLGSEDQVWREALPELGDVELRNIVTVIRGRSPSTIVVVAHRDNAGAGREGDNASGTAALMELARPFGTLGAVPPPVPQRTLALVSTDAGAWGGAGAVRFAAHSAESADIVAVVVLDGLAQPGRPRIAVAAGAVASPARALVSTAAARIREHAETSPELPSALQQLVSLGIPFAADEQGPFLAHGMAAVTISGASPSARAATTGPQSRETTLGALGRAAEALVASVDASPRRTFGTPDALFLDGRVMSGWAVRLLLVAAVAPFAVGIVDLVTRARRRRLPLRPAVRALRARILFWLFGGLLLWIAAQIGVLPTGSALPFPPTVDVAGDWSPAGAVLLAAAFVLGWIAVRQRLAPDVSASPAEALAGYTTALTWLGAVAVVAAVARPYALVFLLPCLYAWLWLPLQTRPHARAALYLIGLMGPIAGVLVLGSTLGTGPFATARYIAGLATVGYIPAGTVLFTIAWAAAAAQLGALAFGRYAPYASGVEPPPPGPLRRSVGSVGRKIAASRQASAT
ncbi:MAG: M28 family peptidase [Gaiellaceae bacterium]